MSTLPLKLGEKTNVFQIFFLFVFLLLDLNKQKIEQVEQVVKLWLLAIHTSKLFIQVTKFYIQSGMAKVH